uniref:Uncharacterized LOC115552295 n=2 Tax=Gadus morhua TaxID=8049 RepID=A0A8C5FSZ6_GADMO
MESFMLKSFITARTALVQLQRQNVTMYFAMITLSTALLIQAQESPRLVSMESAGLGDTVTLHCEAQQMDCSNLYWYKQCLGCYPEMVASKVFQVATMKPHINLTLTEVEGACVFNLIIQNVTKGDEANYFCQQYTRAYWNNGTFLSIKDDNHRFVSQTVVQQPVSASAQLGDPVSLECSITSQRTDHSSQCRGEPSVYWFRSGSGPSHSAAIYMNGNRRGECQNSSGPPSAPQSCVYTLPKNNVDSSDAGTYYCALAACGEVVFGNGIKLEITEPNRHLVTMVLGILLACCLAVITILFLTRNKKYVCDHRKGTLSASFHAPRDSQIQKQQDGETDSLNYAALEFSGRKTKGGKKNTERNQESVYSAVRET